MAKLTRNRKVHLNTITAFTIAGLIVVIFCAFQNAFYFTVALFLAYTFALSCIFCIYGLITSAYVIGCDIVERFTK